MDKDQITALAREYADMLKHLFPDMPEHTYRDKMSQAKNVIGIIMRRYCLVEKSKVEQMYKEAAEGKCELEKMQPQNTYAKNSILMKVGMNAGCAYTLKHLFPDLGKEVEG